MGSGSREEKGMITMTAGTARIVQHAMRYNPVFCVELEDKIDALLDPRDVDAKGGEMFEEVVHLKLDEHVQLRIYYRHDEEMNEYELCGSLSGPNWAVDDKTMSVVDVPLATRMRHAERADRDLKARDVIDLEILGESGVALVIAPEVTSADEDANTTIYMLDHTWSLSTHKLEQGKIAIKDPQT